MIFVYRKWDEFCRNLQETGRISLPAKDVKSSMESFLVLKHDIENNVPKAYELASIENKYGHKGTYYLHAYLLDNPKNIELLKKMQKMGHEISYHHDVMDSNHGNIESAIIEFQTNVKRFDDLGFKVVTVCQHGNPIVERIGYTSNRDFFRNQGVRCKFSSISDIMVDYKLKYEIDYTYYSDAGRKFNLIFDPIDNDLINSDDKNTPYESLEELLSVLDSRAIISTHPHRWAKSAIIYIINEKSFKLIKMIAKTLVKIPFFKKIMSKYYYLAKKI